MSPRRPLPAPTAPRPVVTVDREALELYMNESTARLGSTGTSEWEARADAAGSLRRSLADAPAAGQVLELDGVGILLDGYGVALGETANTSRVVMVMDLGGSLSGSNGTERVRHRYVMPSAVGAELVVALLNAGRSEVSREAFLEALASMQAEHYGRPD